MELIGECRDLGDDRLAWRQHLMDRLGRLVDADTGVIGEMAGCRESKNIDLGVIFWAPGGFSPPSYWQAHMEQFRDDQGHSPAMSGYHDLNRTDRGVALTRGDFIEDRDWYGSYDFVKVQEPLGLDASLWCFRPIPSAVGDEHTGIVFARDKGRRDFSPRDRTIVSELHAAISPLVGGALARFADPSPLDLPPRAREVLACLLEGDGDKQVAHRLGLSPLTVNQYTKRIYQHFGVQSRAELLARWVRRGWGKPFSWTSLDEHPGP